MKDTDQSDGTLGFASSVLAVCAHPDDESFGLGATLAHLTGLGADVAVLCFTHGEASTLGKWSGPLREIRSSELAAAAAELGVGRVELLDYPDGALSTVPLALLSGEVERLACDVGAGLVLVFDEAGITGHPDHVRATEAALAASVDVPVLAWSLPQQIAAMLASELGLTFLGRQPDEMHIALQVDREAQRRAISRHTSQCTDNPVVWRRLELQGDKEFLRWLRRPEQAAIRAESEAPERARHGTPAHASPADDPPAHASPAEYPPAHGAGSHGHGGRFRELAAEWDRRYEASPQLFRSEPDATLVELAGPLVPGRAVDLGAGEGRNSLWLARRGWDVLSVDASEVALRRLRSAASSEGLSLGAVVGDLLTELESFDARHVSFGLVVMAFVHPPPQERRELLTAVARAVSPGGHLFVVGHHIDSIGLAGPQDAMRLYTDDDLARAALGLEVLRLERRRGVSDVEETGTDALLWARRPA